MTSGTTFLVLIALSSSIIQKDTDAEEDEQRKRYPSAIVEGDVMLGGLFPVHKRGGLSNPCGEISSARGIQRLEAMLYSIDEINNNENILPGLQLGAVILDTCSQDTYALEQALEFVRASMTNLDSSDYKCEDGSTALSTTGRSVPVVGVIGSSYSSVSIQVANLLRLFRIPQISYASTSAALSDKTRYELFARTVPPDNYQAQAMVDIVQYFKWTYVSTVASEDDYGILGIDSFQNEARSRNICIALSEKIPHSATVATFDEVVSSLMRRPVARVLVLFLRVEDAKGLLSAIKRQNISNHFIYIASDGWGRQTSPVDGNELVAEGALTIELQSKFISEFDTYFRELNPFKNKRNPWFIKYWEHVHNCRLNIGGQRLVRLINETIFCTGYENLRSSNYKQESKIQFVYDAVYAMAHALHNYLSDRCVNNKITRTCLMNLTMDGSILYKNYILNVSFLDGHGGMVQFDENGDGLGRYYIFNYRRNQSTRQFEYEPVGQWTSSGLVMREESRIVWSSGGHTLPESRCSKPCQRDEIKNVQQGDTCCWICTPCKPYEYVIDEFQCRDCGKGFWPHKNKTSCYKLEERYIDWGSLYAIIPICISAVGIVMTLLVMIVFIKNRETPIVKASGRELSMLLLVGFLVCYSMSFILLMRPTPVVCALQRFGVGFGFAITYASLLTKTNRISRIFASRSARRPPCISPRSQLFISAVVISIQVIFSGVWLVLEPPATRHFFLGGQRDQVILKCQIKDISFLVSLIYNMVLIIVCTVYAVKTRKIPENFNESKFIGFAMYTTCIVWLAFVPIYFGTLNSFEVQTTTLCVSVSLSASVALLCLFTPKMYIIVLHPEKNVRKLTMNDKRYTKSPSRRNGKEMEAVSCKLSGKLGHFPTSQVSKSGGTTTEMETDKDSASSLMMDEIS